MKKKKQNKILKRAYNYAYRMRKKGTAVPSDYMSKLFSDEKGKLHVPTKFANLKRAFDTDFIDLIDSPITGKMLYEWTRSIVPGSENPFMPIIRDNEDDFFYDKQLSSREIKAAFDLWRKNTDKTQNELFRLRVFSILKNEPNWRNLHNMLKDWKGGNLDDIWYT